MKYKLFTCPTTFACAVTGHTANLTWQNNDTYTALTLTGAPGGAISIPPARQSYSLTLPSGSYTLKLKADKGTNSCELSCDVSVNLLCIESVATAVDKDDVTATWTNADAYTQIVVSVDGTDVQTLAGDAATATVNDLAVGAHQLCVVGTDAGTGLCTKVCSDFTIAAPPVKFVRGDANVDADLNIADAVKTLQVLFANDTNFQCADALDANDDGDLNIADAIKLLDAIFVGAVLPAPTTCGPDPTADSLGCDGFTACAQGW